MSQKTRPTSFDPKEDVRTDFALVATAIGAALFALIYLIMI